MKKNKPGPKGIAQVTVISNQGIKQTKRPTPPPDMNEAMKVVWNTIVNSLEHDWFTKETEGLLVQYCRHTVASDKISELIVKYEKKKRGFKFEDYDRLLKMQERESRTIASLATRMRLTQQAKYTAQSAATRSKNRDTGTNPWDED